MTTQLPSDCARDDAAQRANELSFGATHKTVDSEEFHAVRDMLQEEFMGDPGRSMLPDPVTAAVLIVVGLTGGQALASERICKISVDRCFGTPPAHPVGVTLDSTANDEVSCAGRAAAWFNDCQLGLAANAPQGPQYPWRIKAELIGDGVADVAKTVARTVYYGSPVPQLPQAGEPLIGAIRFDEWYANDDLPPSRRFPEKDALLHWAPGEEWQRRLPFYTKVDDQPVSVPYTNLPLDPARIRFEADLQSAMDAEIEYANRGGINYWSFNWWGRWNDGELFVEPPLDPHGAAADWKNQDLLRHNRALQLYLSSNVNRLVRFALLVPMNRFGPRRTNCAANQSDPFCAATDAEFSARLDDGNLVSSWFEVYLEQWLVLASHSTYQTVIGDRPLLFLYALDFPGPLGLKTLATYFGNATRARAAIARIRERFQEFGLANPYIVGMFRNRGGQLSYGSSYASDDWGLDAISRYSANVGTSIDGSCAPLPCTELPTMRVVSGSAPPRNEERAGSPAVTGNVPPYLATPPGLLGNWHTLIEGFGAGDPGIGPADDNKTIVPPMMVGYDARPRYIPYFDDQPYPGHTATPWGEVDDLPSADSHLLWSEHASPAEIASLTEPSHLTEILDWTRSNAANAEANAILLYAWNEFSEGGWLAPTFGDGNARLEAIREVVCEPADANDPEGTCHAPPVGEIDGLYFGAVTGWAYDPDRPDESITVEFYAGADKYNGGRLIGVADASGYDAALNAAQNIAGFHRFYFAIPTRYATSSVKLFAHAVDPVGDSYSPGVPWGIESTARSTPECSDGIDNDGDQLVDYSADLDCSSVSDASESSLYFYPKPQCKDGIDNDLDGAIDHPADAGCIGPADATEQRNCADGIDNDDDGAVDFSGLPLNADGDFIDREFPPDPSCGAWGLLYEGDVAYDNCSDGIDNDGDGLADSGIHVNADSDYDDAEAPPEPGCVSATDAGEDPGTQSQSCGLGVEMAVVLVALSASRRRQWRVCRR